jgi:mono/diheme cytochrome c family protein
MISPTGASLLNRKAVIAAIALMSPALFPVIGQQTSAFTVFTAAQAEAGRVAYEKTCGRCHTLTLMGRQGNPDERPAVSSLSEADQKFIANSGGRVPPLAGKIFLQRWGSKTAAHLIARFQEAKFSFEEAGLTDDESIVDITAYVLQVNGAKSGTEPLTRTTGALVSSLTH